MVETPDGPALLMVRDRMTLAATPHRQDRHFRPLGHEPASPLLLLALQAAILFAMGRLPICACGYVKLWHGVVKQLGEFAAHRRLVHALRTCCTASCSTALTWLLFTRAAVAWPARLIVAMLIEGAWELVENSPFIIERYRAGTISLDYYGDSIVNSVSDKLAMVLRLPAATRKLPVTATVAARASPSKLVMALHIRDNLTLNIIMLIHPFEADQAMAGGPPDHLDARTCRLPRPASRP